MRILPLFTLLLAAPLAAQTGTPDQLSPTGGASFNMDATSLTWQQQVRVGVGGILEGLQFELYAPAPTSVPMEIRLGDAWNIGPSVWSGTVNLAGLGSGNWETIFVDVSSAGISLSPNDTFVFELTGGGGGAWMSGSYVAPPGIPGYPEPLYLNQNIHGSGGWVLGFESFMLSGPPTPTLAISGSCPGPGQVTMSNLTPNGRIAIASSPLAGPSVVGGGSGCAGAAIGLVGPTLRMVDFADANGDYFLLANLPSAACGTLFVQGFDLGTCLGTNVLAL